MDVLWPVLLVLLVLLVQGTLMKTHFTLAQTHPSHRSRKVVDDPADVDFALLLSEQPDRLMVYCTTQLLMLLWQVALLVLCVAGLLLWNTPLTFWGCTAALLLVLLCMLYGLRKFLWMAHLYLFTRDRVAARKAHEHNGLPEIQQ